MRRNGAAFPKVGLARRRSLQAVSVTAQEAAARSSHICIRVVAKQKEWWVRKTVRQGAVRRGAIIFTMAAVLVGLIGSPAHATLKPGGTQCSGFNMKNLTADVAIENAKLELFDKGTGNVLDADVAVSVVVNAVLEVCVKATAEVDVIITLGAVLDGDKNGKKDTIVVNVEVLAKADAQVSIIAKLKGTIGLTVAVAAQVDVDFALKGGEKKDTGCKAKDGYDQY